jgi:oligopeptide transport system substrate-binding protein
VRLPGRGRLTLLAWCLVLAACTTGAPSDSPPDDRPEPVVGDEAEAPTDEGPRRGGTLRVGLSADPVTIDPRFLVDDPGELVVDALFDPLVRVDRDLGIVPAAADSWELDEDGRTFTFHLREASFHDGTPVTAADFKRTFDHIADGAAEPRSYLAYLLEPVVGSSDSQEQGGPLAGVRAVDARTLQIELREPRPGFLATLSDPSLVPVPPAANDDPEAYALQPIGNGPFAMAAPREVGQFLRLSRFADHPDPALLDEVLLTVYLEDRGFERQWNDLQDGLLQVAEVAPERFDEAATVFGTSEDGYTGPGLLRGTTSTVYLYAFDVTRPPFDDVRVRRAISLALDRDALADEVLRGARQAANAIVPPPIPGSRPGACSMCRHDPEQAATLLAEVAADGEVSAPDDEPADGDESGVDGQEEREDADGDAGEGDQEPEGADAEAGDGADAETGAEAGDGADAEDGADTDEATDAAGDPGGEERVLDRVTLAFNRGPTHAAIAERMAADLEAALDVEVDVVNSELQAFVQAVRRGDHSVFRLGWDASEPDPGAYLYPLFHSSQIGQDNLSRYSDEEVDALLDAARADPERGASLRAYGAAERAVLDDLPVVPLLWYQHGLVVAPTVRDLHVSPFGRMDLARAWLGPDAG